MCTAKIPPRPRLFLLAAHFPAGGLLSPVLHAGHFRNRRARLPPMTKYTYYIASSKKQNSDPTYQLLKQDVKSTLSEAGFSLTQDRNRGTALLSIDYTAKTSTKHITAKSRFTDKPGPSKRRTARMTRPRAAIPKPPRRPQPTGRSGMRMKPRKSRSATSSFI